MITKLPRVKSSSRTNLNLECLAEVFPREVDWFTRSGVYFRLQGCPVKGNSEDIYDYPEELCDWSLKAGALVPSDHLLVSPLRGQFDQFDQTYPNFTRLGRELVYSPRWNCGYPRDEFKLPTHWRLDDDSICFLPALLIRLAHEELRLVALYPKYKAPRLSDKLKKGKHK